MSFTYGTTRTGGRLHVMRTKTGHKTWCGATAIKQAADGEMCDKCLAGISWWITKAKKKFSKIKTLAS